MFDIELVDRFLSERGARLRRDLDNLRENVSAAQIAEAQEDVIFAALIMSYIDASIQPDAHRYVLELQNLAIEAEKKWRAARSTAGGRVARGPAAVAPGSPPRK